jgi:hypothetical protein
MACSDVFASKVSDLLYLIMQEEQGIGTNRNNTENIRQHTFIIT